MRTLTFLLRKEFRQIIRNKAMLPMIFIMPIMQLTILPLSADYEIKNITISIVDKDQSSTSRVLIDKISSSGYFKINDLSATFPKAFESFESGKTDLILEIPQDFEQNILRENSQNLFLAANAINGTKALMGNAYINRVISDFNNDVRLEWMEPYSMNPAPIIDVRSSNWFNPSQDYQTFMVPGILVVLVTMIGAYLCAINIVKEKEIGTIEQINVTPIKKHHFILGKLIPFWLIGIFVFTIGLFLVARVLYGIVPVGNIFLLYGYLALYLFAVIGIGLLISTYSETQQQAMSVAFFFMMIFILMSGLYTSIDSMPIWAKGISYASPVTYFIDVIRMIVLKGSEFKDVQFHFAITAFFALFFNAWAILNYRKTT